MTREEYNRVLELLDLMVRKPIHLIGTLLEGEHYEAATLAVAALHLQELGEKLESMVVEPKTHAELEEAVSNYSLSCSNSVVEDNMLKDSKPSEVARETQEVASGATSEVK